MVSRPWRTQPLGEVATLQRGYDLPYRMRKSGSVPIITSSGVGGTHSQAMVSGPGVVTGRYGTIGEVFFVQEDFWPLNTTLYVRHFHGNDPLFISYLLRTIDFHTHSGKSGVPGVNRNDLHELVVSVPPTKAEQRAIAEALSDADALIDSLEQLIAKKRQIKQGAMQELLTGKRRLPGFDGEWIDGKMSDCFTPVTTRNEELNDNVVTISAQQGFVRQEEFFTKRVASKILSNYYLLHSGHFAYNRSTSNGYPFGAVKWLNRYDKAVVTTLYICFRPKDGTPVSAPFFAHYFDAGLLNAGLAPVANEGGRAHGLLNVTRDDFFSRPLVVPPLAEQTAIAAVLGDMDAEITALETKLGKARQLKQGLMQDLLTGRIRLV